MRGKRKSLRRVAAGAVLLGIGFGLLGCSTVGTTVQQTQGAESAALQFEDRTLASQVIVAGASHREVGDLLQAQVTLQSRRDRSLRVQYRFVWYDAEGVEIDRKSQAYRDLIIEGREGVTVTSMAPSAAARTYRMKMRKVKTFRIDNLWW